VRSTDQSYCSGTNSFPFPIKGASRSMGTLQEVVGRCGKRLGCSKHLLDSTNQHSCGEQLPASSEHRQWPISSLLSRSFLQSVPRMLSLSHKHTLAYRGQKQCSAINGVDGLGQPQAPCFLRGATEVLPTWILRGSTERMSQRQPRSSRSCQSLTFFALPTPDSYHFLLLFLEFTPTTESKNHPQA
jgi:hypothetical protein